MKPAVDMGDHYLLEDADQGLVEVGLDANVVLGDTLFCAPIVGHVHYDPRMTGLLPLGCRSQLPQGATVCLAEKAHDGQAKEPKVQELDTL